MNLCPKMLKKDFSSNNKKKLRDKKDTMRILSKRKSVQKNTMRTEWPKSNISKRPTILSLSHINLISLIKSLRSMLSSKIRLRKMDTSLRTKSESQEESSQ